MVLKGALLRKCVRSPGLLFTVGLAMLFLVAFHWFSNNAARDPVLLVKFFDGFDNETGADHFIVPNIIHLIRFNKSEFSFVDYLCIQSAFQHHSPDYFYIHTNVVDGLFTGKYWWLIENEPELFSRIKIKYLDPPADIFGQPLNPEFRLFHGGDIARIRTMMKYGGIYLDNDVFVIQSLDKYRKFEIAMNWDEGQSLGSQVIVAHKNARFLPLWLDSYHEYHPESWQDDFCYTYFSIPSILRTHHFYQVLQRRRKTYSRDPDEAS